MHRAPTVCATICVRATQVAQSELLAVVTRHGLGSRDTAVFGAVQAVLVKRSNNQPQCPFYSKPASDTGTSSPTRTSLPPRSCGVVRGRAGWPCIRDGADLVRDGRGHVSGFGGDGGYSARCDSLATARGRPADDSGTADLLSDRCGGAFQRDRRWRPHHPLSAEPLRSLGCSVRFGPD